MSKLEELNKQYESSIGKYFYYIDNIYHRPDLFGRITNIFVDPNAEHIMFIYVDGDQMISIFRSAFETMKIFDTEEGMLLYKELEGTNQW